MHIGASPAGKALEKIGHQFHLKISHVRRTDFRVDNRSRASAEIDGGAALRASAISSPQLAMRYSAIGAIAG